MADQTEQEPIDPWLTFAFDLSAILDVAIGQSPFRTQLQASIVEKAMAAADAAQVRERDAQIARLSKIVADTLWMAGRYADRRMTYAVGMYNEALKEAEALGCANEAKPAVDGMDPERLSLMEQIASLTQENAQLRQSTPEPKGAPR